MGVAGAHEIHNIFRGFGHVSLKPSWRGGRRNLHGVEELPGGDGHGRGVLLHDLLREGGPGEDLLRLVQVRRAQS